MCFTSDNTLVWSGVLHCTCDYTRQWCHGVLSRRGVRFYITSGDQRKTRLELALISYSAWSRSNTDQKWFLRKIPVLILGKLNKKTSNSNILNKDPLNLVTKELWQRYVERGTLKDKLFSALWCFAKWVSKLAKTYLLHFCGAISCFLSACTLVNNNTVISYYL